MAPSQIEELKALLDPTEIITPSSPAFTDHSRPFAIQKDYHPSLVVAPKTLAALSKAVKFLAASDLDFKVRSTGFGSASAKDVIVSMTAFDTFEFDEGKETLLLGAGQRWKDYYEKMEKVAPEWSVVSIRTPNLGIGGSVLCAGFSWLSGEYGCLSDPANMLDVQVVKMDGSVIWASEEPDLLWALRGTEGAFAIAVNFKFRARKYPQKVWSGPILLPNTAPMRKQICDGILGMDTDQPEPKVAMFLYMMNPEIIKLMGDGENGDMIVVHAFDARGEESGRKEFDWALSVPGSIDRTSYQTRRELAMMQFGVGQMMHTQTMYWNPILLPKLTESILMNAFGWYEKISTAGDGSIGPCSSLLFELFSVTDAPDRLASAWPRPVGCKHMVLLGSGARSVGPMDDLAQKLVVGGSEEVLGKGVKLNVTPNALEAYHDSRDVYGENYDKLMVLKRKYDPKNKLKGPFRI